MPEDRVRAASGGGGLPSAGGPGGAGHPAGRGGCELCEASRITPWHHEDELCWVADCEICDVPMVVWKRHGPAPPQLDLERMLAELERVARARFGEDGYWVDQVMRQIPDHFHAHARDHDWIARRFGRRAALRGAAGGGERGERGPARGGPPSGGV